MRKILVVIAGLWLIWGEEARAGICPVESTDIPIENQIFLN